MVGASNRINLLSEFRTSYPGWQDISQIDAGNDVPVFIGHIPALVPFVAITDQLGIPGFATSIGEKGG
jgi:hypothetical protein